MSDSAIIQIENLRFRWSPRDEPCIELPHLQVQAGERIFLHGPSGSGKSTLLGLFGGVLVPEQGSIRVMDVDITALRGSARDRFRADHVGLIFQQFNLVPYLSVIDNVLLACRFSASRAKQALSRAPSLQQEAERLLDHLDIASGLRRRAAAQLSVGQQQRVAAARALIGRPGIVIADEPTSSLDEGRQQAFLDLLMRECDAAGATLLFVSHDRRLARLFGRAIDLQAVNRAAAGAET